MAGNFGDRLASAARERNAPRRGRRAGARAGLLAILLGVAGLAHAATQSPNPGVATDPAAQNLGNTFGPGAIVIPGNNAAAGGVASNVPGNVRPVAANAQPNAAVGASTSHVAPASQQSPQAAAVPVNSQFQNTEVVRQTAERFLREQTTGLPGRVTITVGDSVSDRMPACGALEPFLPPGARLWGSTTVGVRCAGERPWTLYLQARVSINATYFVAARQINPGETIGPNDLSPRQGDLTLLPRTVATDAGQIVGTVAVNRITSGLPIRSDLLRSAIAVQQGQTVRVVSRGSGFEVSTEGQVLSRASAGDPVQVRTRAGQVVSGTVKTGKGGNVEVEVAL
ncbi:flagellar basal body P-ring formation chaperone FlgA [Pandoraea pulmonicola]|uniref:Flagella basal body P-ring formation protein FlgA n=1 Tax=Pandoraea pulmonicola TaxID=93221 RepID=A0AAJ4ZD97_PANPU|nr:flagellar basal body P-ring formation chaperone FlgA [Pandoraea pulmonicola]APD13703.1 flagella basal body P-ring formation protein FlgA [Pandoraea pulmonicola]SUA91165.1 flagellar basal body P-ring biosynthesis protein FlgA [Pandoraea pulmonicola]